MLNIEQAGRQLGRYIFVLLIAVLSVTGGAGAQEASWEPIDNPDALRQFMSGLEAERDVPGKGTSRAEYLEDGSGVLHAWGESFPRTWTVNDDGQLCITQETGRKKSLCYLVDRNAPDPTLYRVRRVDKDKSWEFRAEAHRAVAESGAPDAPKDGGAAAASASEIAAKLADPNAVIGTMTMNFDYIAFDGDLPNANSQSSLVAGFQPSLPYSLGGGKNFFVRPLIPIVIDKSVPDGEGGFTSEGVELGDIGFDAAVGFSLEGGRVVIAGLAGSMPTATEDAVGSDQWLLGPELAFFLVRKWGAVGLFASHLWDVAGEDSFDTSITSGQYIYSINLTGGWQISGSPSWSYNHEAESGQAWSIPLGTGIAKTAILGGRPWKMGAQYWYFVEAPDAFGPKHQIRFSIGPVVNLPWKGRQ